MSGDHGDRQTRVGKVESPSPLGWVNEKCQSALGAERILAPSRTLGTSILSTPNATDRRGEAAAEETVAGTASGRTFEEGVSRSLESAGMPASVFSTDAALATRSLALLVWGEEQEEQDEGPRRPGDWRRDNSARDQRRAERSRDDDERSEAEKCPVTPKKYT
jgi:hypothetical protein